MQINFERIQLKRDIFASDIFDDLSSFIFEHTETELNAYYLGVNPVCFTYEIYSSDELKNYPIKLPVAILYMLSEDDEFCPIGSPIINVEQFDNAMDAIFTLIDFAAELN